jgi:hypothetical protein
MKTTTKRIINRVMKKKEEKRHAIVKRACRILVLKIDMRLQEKKILKKRNKKPAKKEGQVRIRLPEWFVRKNPDLGIVMNGWVCGEIVRETEKAYNFFNENGFFWIPKSIILE